MQAADYSGFTKFTDLGLSPVLLHIGSFDLRWYSIAYLAGIFVGYWYLLKLIAQPGQRNRTPDNVPGFFVASMQQPVLHDVGRDPAEIAQ